MTPGPANVRVNYISAKVAIMSISSCGILFAILSLILYPVVKVDVMVGAGIWCVSTIGASALILFSTLGDA